MQHDRPPIADDALNATAGVRSQTERFDAQAMPHVNDIFRAAARMVGDRTRAEDIAQEVFLQAWKSFHRFEAGTNCKAWLFKILFHCVSHHRRHWFRWVMKSEAEDSVEIALAYTPPVSDRLTDEEILRAMDQLTADYRSVILLVDVEEFSYKEVAEILSIPIGTVMSRLSRGRKALRETLADTARSYGVLKAKKEGSGL